MIKKHMIIGTLFLACKTIGAMQALEEQQQQEPTVTIVFGFEENAPKKEISQKYTELSPILKTTLERSIDKTTFISAEFQNAFEVLESYFPILFAMSDEEKYKKNHFQQQLIEHLSQEKGPGSLNNKELGTLANLADYLNIQDLVDAIISVCEQRMVQHNTDEFLTSEDPLAFDFNPYGLHEALLKRFYTSIAQPAINFLEMRNTSTQTLPKKHSFITLDASGTMLASAREKAITIWQQVNGTWQIIAKLKESVDQIDSLALSPSGKILAVGSFTGYEYGEDDEKDANIHLWEKEMNNKWRQIATLQGHTEHIISIAWNSDATIFASKSEDTTIRLWQKVQESWQTVAVLKGGYSGPVALSPDGNKLASGDEDTVTVWQQTDSLWKIVATLTVDGIKSLSWNTDNTILACSSSYGPVQMIRQLAAERWQRTNVLDKSSEILVWSPDGTMLASEDTTDITVWQQFSERWSPIKKFKEDNDEILSLDWKGSTLASLSNGVIRLHHIPRDDSLRLIRAMEPAQCMLLRCAYQYVMKKGIHFPDYLSDRDIFATEIEELNVAKYPNLLPTYESFNNIDGKDYLDFINSIILDSNRYKTNISKKLHETATTTSH